ncbi:MAG: hypothetical protein FJ096_15875 [Deltaproteobacteria bacterium]|nr:hypothetical protein [Deltaproteobacteria bacterium]
MAALKAAMAGSVDAGEYSWGLMETHPWVKIKAKSGSLCTKDGGTYMPDPMPGGMVVASLECGDGDADEALVNMVNGNLAFHFATPLAIGTEAARVDILFNLDEIVSAMKGGLAGGAQLRNAAGDAGSRCLSSRRLPSHSVGARR